ncbi:IclR family transcriptional regulator [Burkholderia oklahomensis]|uniref:IclR family transcriptional regulator n=1 Tax=Burkholderia oklahomensis TaxID=342113 RepID=UPI00016A9B43|nr:IclR family transcriptional regulator [Burkholderia oklahomensis]AJX35768.1 iclR helix-turn-helix domain protein [Burkholderia oklahomensis C6786]AOI49168.1 IclR family transcriptional regulator [Burkholderia oklahomensis C6786]KUY60782.1 IclR family transcriptional regulator [Burkholderia oklahomensis C6786]MBI0362595.1 IclR family transcriptional regulator [Burkholderia oklahomensis]SUY26701.1 Negative regulator of allantoin and glyoxylate utilization operons [Burkholderia oklahomensis]
MAKTTTTAAAKHAADAASGNPRNSAAAPGAAPEAADDEAAGGASSYLVPGLERGLRILSEFSAREPVLSAPELSKRIGIPRTTTFRLLQTLEALGFIERANGDRHFRLGVGVLRLGFEYLNSLELTDLGTPVLERLRDTTGLSTHLLIRDRRDVVFVAKAQSNAPMFGSVKVHVGTRLPAHATVHGHVLMGDLTRDAMRQLYPEKRLEAFTEHTPATVDELYERVRHYARLGYAVSEGAFESGISAVTAPVRDHSGSIVAAITATVPRSEIGAAEEKERLVETVCGAAVDLSQRLNYRPLDSDPTVAHARHKVALF